jgi:hypothetical protein
LRFGACCDWQTGFAGFAREFQFFVGGDAPFFSVHHGESSFGSKVPRRWNGREGDGGFFEVRKGP